MTRKLSFTWKENRAVHKAYKLGFIGLEVYNMYMILYFRHSGIRLNSAVNN